MKNKKGQMQMMETIGVLFIFFVLVLFGAIFYFKFQEVSFENQQEEVLAQRAMDSTLVALFLPELQCSRGETESEDNCLDLSKIRAMEKIVQERGTDYYFDIFSYAKITVNMVYPANHEWVLYDFEKKETLESGEEVASWDRKEPSYFVITLKDETRGREMGIESGKYSFGYLTVEVYS